MKAAKRRLSTISIYGYVDGRQKCGKRLSPKPSTQIGLLVLKEIKLKKTKNIKNKRKRYIVRYSVKGVREGRDMHAANGLFSRLHTLLLITF